jgi:hypothetical protein
LDESSIYTLAPVLNPTSINTSSFYPREYFSAY